MVAERLPTLGEQTALYRSVFESAGDLPVTFRTLDIGGDKILPYMAKVDEENPALGWRAIRIGLDRPGLLRAQIRALLRAAENRDLRIMFPMIATIDEFERAKAIVGREQAHLARFGHAAPRSVQLGVMVEVPSLLFTIDEIAARADFMSVGSNDLMQFLFAADRDNQQLAGRFDSCNPACLRALKMVADAGAKAGIPVTLCGELAGRPVDAMVLLALGYRGLSMSPLSIGPVKAMILDLELAPVRHNIETLLRDNPAAASLREDIIGMARNMGLV